VAERTSRYRRFSFFFSSYFFLKKTNLTLGPRTLCNACGLVYAKLVCNSFFFMARARHFYSNPFFFFGYCHQIKKRFKEKVVNPNKKSVSGNKGGGGGGLNMNNISTPATARGSGGGGGGGGMYGMAGEESVDELSDDDEYGSQDARKDMPD
jgi:hypothetical protein